MEGGPVYLFALGRAAPHAFGINGSNALPGMGLGMA